jgi:hypothetical protein
LPANCQLTDSASTAQIWQNGSLNRSSDGRSGKQDSSTRAESIRNDTQAALSHLGVATNLDTAIAVQADLSKSEDQDLISAELLEKSGAPDTLVNNAAVTDPLLVQLAERLSSQDVSALHWFGGRCVKPDLRGTARKSTRGRQSRAAGSSSDRAPRRDATSPHHPVGTHSLIRRMLIFQPVSRNRD